MSRSVFLPLLIYGLLLAGLAALNAAILVLAVPLLVTVAVALTRSTGPASLQVMRQLETNTIEEGEPVGVTLTVTNTGDRLLEWVEIADQTAVLFTIIEGATTTVAALAPGETVTLHYTIQGHPGQFMLPPVHISGNGTLGLFPWQLSEPVLSRLTVIPQFPRLRPVTIRPLHTLGFTGPIPSRQSGAGIDFFGVRAYQPGDPLRRVNWRATARHGDLPFTTELEQDRIADIGLIVDTRPDETGLADREPLLLHGVRAAAALADGLLRDGHRVGLLLYGLGTWVFPGYGRRQRERILRALASTEPTSSYAFHSLNHLPTQLFPAHSQLLFVSPLRPEDEDALIRLRAQGYSLLILSPDPISYELRSLPTDKLLPLATRLARLERQLVLQRLQQAGIVVVDWPVDQDLDQVLAAFLRRTPPIRHVRRLS